MKQKFHGFLGLALSRRYSDGGSSALSSAAGAAPQGDSTDIAGTVPDMDPPQPKSPEEAPLKTETKVSEENSAEKAYTKADLDAAEKRAVEAYKQHLKEATDYNKMTPEEKVAHLEKQMADEKLTRYTAEALSKAGIDASLAEYAKGTDEQTTNERVKAFKAAFDKAVQAGVENRFKAIGYTPRAGGIGSTSGSDTACKKPRGVSIK